MPKRFHPASLHTAEDHMHDEVDLIADAERPSIKNSWWLLVTRGASRFAASRAALVHKQHDGATKSNRFDVTVPLAYPVIV